jgi:hypothetical protein
MLLIGASSLRLAAQSFDNDSVKFRPELSRVNTTMAWMTGTNTAMLNIGDVGQVSEAEVFYGKTSGDLANYNQSTNSDRWGAAARSLYRLSDRVMMRGAVSYTNFTGRGMAGSAFINPAETPFDIVEYTTDREGKKTLEKYNLAGAIGVKLNDKFNVGAAIDFTAANYAKNRDLRHKNKLLDMWVTASATWSATDNFTVGANYYYRRSIEGVEFSQYGATDNIIFTSLINYGAFFGVTEAFGDATGYTCKNEEKPLVDQYHGVGVQWLWRADDHIDWSGDLSWKTRSGYYGKKSPYTVVYTDHDGSVISLSTSLAVRGESGTHAIALSVDRNTVNNRENIYRTENNAGGQTDVSYYGTNDVGDRTLTTVGVDYNAYLGTENGSEVWALGASADFVKRDVKAVVYPYYRRQNLTWSDINVNAERFFFSRANRFGVKLGVITHFGGGDKAVDGAYATGSQSPLKTHTVYLDREYEYLTKTRLGVDLAFSYRLHTKSMDYVARLGGEYVKALNAEALGNARSLALTVSVGLNF